MPATISFSLNITTQSSHAHQIRPALPKIVAENDVKQTITMNKIASTAPKKHLNGNGCQRLEAKRDFLPLTPTIIKTPSVANVDIQARLGRMTRSSLLRSAFLPLCRSEAVILKTVDCEMIDLFNQMVRAIHFRHSFHRLRRRNANRRARRSTTISRRYWRNSCRANTNTSLAAW